MQDSSRNSRQMHSRLRQQVIQQAKRFRLSTAANRHKQI
jgi:hypothetical protein